VCPIFGLLLQSPPSRSSFEHVVEAGVAVLHAVGHAGGDRAPEKVSGTILRTLGFPDG